MKVLYFFPHPIYPSKTGAQFRAVQTLSSLSRLGIEVHLATFSHPHYHWSTSDRNAISRFLCRSVTHLNQYHPGPERTRQGAPMKSLFFPENNRFLPDFFDQSSAAAREWIEETLQRWSIDCMIIPYPVYAGLVPQSPDLHRIIELYDLWTLNSAMQDSLKLGFESGLSSLQRQSLTDSPTLDRDFLPRQNIQPSPLEKRALTQFQSAIAISHAEESVLRDLGTRNVARIPVMVTLPAQTSACEGPPCMALGPNLLNLQGLAHFRHRLLPRITERAPDFRCDLYGSVPHVDSLDLSPHIRDRGFVPGFSDALCSAGFFINPVFSGTGMQIKTVEAMSYGLPPVCYDNVSKDAGVKHLENGWVADSETSFVEGVVTLASDPVLRQRLGLNARQHIRETMSESELDSRLGAFMTIATAPSPSTPSI